MSRKKVSIPEAVLSALSGYQPSVKLADIYDEDEDLRSALIEGVPGFEYPNYSWMTISQLQMHLAAAA
ncbi:hypothetical protein IPC1147_33130 [Pseudomonas aeruginosa]|uniref:hypothetical protein n=1 Tax=Pseudomonas aeruginosa TaxID=287 RepID=UPI000E697075|nr:hypothetical protein [Pseudomonas aeruginosa]MBA5107653.1 hypothetical protein [Pseudomonas aeruginosa]MBD1300092.1 hypothetical protein [Pseudomonas aeruginosa]MBD1340657.1 hypothetical protein [Pseudomonas aeruginosa]MCO2528453.1 hypothetical protein [Pseudomonas aeruginosa]MCO2541427.1 hypothetical protein [Pseudomonas aeruginosa]